MAQRSPFNDRYKVDQKGKTRKSAAGAKPKRAIADLTPADAPKKSQKKTTAWGRAKSASKPAASSAMAAVESTPRMKELRKIWWYLWVGALVIAVGILLLQQFKVNIPIVVGVAWAIWFAAMGGAFYIEFGPMRKERAAAAAAAKQGGKPAKSDKAPAPDDRTPPKDPA
jgi:hypothetical protein